MITTVAGVDSGGSRTRLLICDAAGEELVSLEGEGAAIRGGDAARSARIIEQLVREGIQQLPPEAARPAALCAGVAGAGRAERAHELEHALAQAGLAEMVTVQTDASIAFHDALSGRAGIMLLAGTGSIAMGRGPTGTVTRAGGWGPVCGDEGGGYWIGRRALSVVTASADGREPETSLTGAILTAAELVSPDDLIAWSESASLRQIAQLAPVVMQEARNGDVRAESLITLAAEELMAHVRSLARALFVDERSGFTVALAGSLLQRGSLLRKRVATRMKQSLPGAALAEREVRPVRGALSIARELCGLSPQEPPPAENVTLVDA